LDVVVASISRLTKDSIIVDHSQIERLCKIIAGFVTPAISEPGERMKVATG
jgi:hypothetical protein